MRAAGGELVAAAFYGGNLLPVGGAGRALGGAGASSSRGSAAPCTSIVGRADAVRAMWARARAGVGTGPRRPRAAQPLLVARPQPPGRAGRPAGARDPSRRARRLPAGRGGHVHRGARRVALAVTPAAGDYRRRVAGLIRDAPRIRRSSTPTAASLFKADLGAVSAAHLPGAGRVGASGRSRAAGIGTAALAAVLRHALTLAPTVSLYVNDFNVAARRMYARLGMREVADLSRRSCSDRWRRRLSARRGDLRLGRHADALAHRRAARRRGSRRSATRSSPTACSPPRTRSGLRSRDEHRSGTLDEVFAAGRRRRRRRACVAAFHALVGAAHLPRPRRAGPVRGAARARAAGSASCRTRSGRGPSTSGSSPATASLDAIDGAVYTSEIPWTKPHPEAFRAALAPSAWPSPARAVFVGDRPFDDIHGAKSVGHARRARAAQRHPGRPERATSRASRRGDPAPGDLSRWSTPGLSAGAGLAIRRERSADAPASS